MTGEDYGRWVLIFSAGEMAQRNSARLEPCIDAGLTSGEAEPCTIEVLAPAHYLAEARAKPADDEAL